MLQHLNNINHLKCSPCQLRLLVEPDEEPLYWDKEPGPRTPTLTTTAIAMEYLNADPVDYLNESPPPRWIT
jgi:hypothetical protein